jgi:superfamily II DNA or RNA helicase
MEKELEKATTDGYTVEDNEKPLQSLSDVRPLYFLPNDPLAEEVLIPGFKMATKVACMVGFFSSEVLASLAPGLATYIASSENSFRLIISPYLRQEDQTALERGSRSPASIAEDVLEELAVTEDLLAQHTLKCLSYLLRTGRIEIMIAVMKDALFHPKVWMFEAKTHVMAAHGSSNFTYAGIKKNFEQISVSKSWEDANQRYIIEKLHYQFMRLWENKEDNCIVIPVSQAVKDKILRTYPMDSPPTEDDFRKLYRRAAGFSDNIQGATASVLAADRQFAIPDWLKYEDGPFEHQGRAINAWCETGSRGILEMATGSGKTITSMICAHRLYGIHKPLLIVVAAPYVPLIEQWCDEIKPFGLKPTNLTAVGGPQQRTKAIQQLKRRLRTGLSEAEAVVVSHDTLCSAAFAEAIASFDCPRLLIADEAHNLGRASFINNPPEFFEHRLALSATPVRQYDAEGTDALFAFFGPVVFRFTLEEAIGRCLVEYNYYIHPVELTDAEMDKWYELTNTIKQNAWRKEDGIPDEFLAKLLRDRRVLLETASGKITKLRALLGEEDLRSLKHTLIYATDKEPAQLNAVNQLLRDSRVLYHQLTAEETASRDKTKRIIGAFQDGEIQVLTAKRVLDEGVNIPQICKAYILASTTVERQWIQRRGRLLRTCSAIGKIHSIIHDFLALPPTMNEGLDADARSLVRSELRRAQEFASLARNAGKPDGPLAIISKLVSAVYL